MSDEWVLSQVRNKMGLGGRGVCSRKVCGGRRKIAQDLGLKGCVRVYVGALA